VKNNKCFKFERTIFADKYLINNMNKERDMEAALKPLKEA
jgi:hypothetical protein